MLSTQGQQPDGGVNLHRLASREVETMVVTVVVVGGRAVEAQASSEKTRLKVQGHYCVIICTIKL